MPGHGLCWLIKLFFSAPLQRGVLGFIFPLLCHLGFKWANVHRARWTTTREFGVCYKVYVLRGVLACAYGPISCSRSKHLCAAVPVCLCVWRPNLCMKQESVNGF